MDKPTLFTINTFETRQDPEYAYKGVYRTSTYPTNKVYASYEDASSAAYAMAQKYASQLKETEESIQSIEDGFVFPMPWDRYEQNAFVVRELEWER